MSLALELQVGPATGPGLPGARLLLAATGAGAIALAGSELLGRDAPWPWLAALATFAVAALLARPTDWGSQHGILRVTADGASSWQPASAAGPTQAAQLQRWQFAPRFAWLELHTSGGKPLRLVLARAAFSAGQWASLGRWLTWVGRDQRPPRLENRAERLN